MFSFDVSFFLDGPARSVNNFVFLGEAGCGKTEIAVNFALALQRQRLHPVHFCDLDMTKPLFRSRDKVRFMEEQGLNVHFEDQFMDAPTAVGGVRRLLADKDCYTVLDVGGDHIGARAVGGYAPLLNAPDTIVWYVINPYRPWSMDIDHIDKVLGETLGVSHVSLDKLRLLGNPNLGPETTAEDVLTGARNTLQMLTPYKPIDFFCVKKALLSELLGKLPVPLFPLQLYFIYEWAD